ncbi:MAG: aminomethyl-transferring glycine dehydrogenase subunit GcvPA, partial [Leucothrix sp.]
MNKLVSQTLTTLEQRDDFITRHNGPDESEINRMLDTIGADSVDELVRQTVPAKILLDEPLALSDACTEQESLSYLKALAEQNTVATSYIGMGYYDTIVPPVILRNVLENPGWYTAYTPYQPEISQGRLEALLNYQQMVTDLTGMDIANASLLDEATAAAEAMALCKRSNRIKSDKFFVDQLVHPQTLDVLKTRAHYFGYELVIGDAASELAENEVFGVMVQYPDTTGAINDIESIITQAHEQKALVCVGADLMSLLLLKAPGEMGADVVFGSAQRFGVPMGFGGPHAAFFAVRDKFKRTMPGRLIGVSVDKKGDTALRMALQTREQHIRRDKATSNICTAQALLANMAGLYAVYHGPARLKQIAQRIHRMTSLVAEALKQRGVTLDNQTWFDTLTVNFGDDSEDIYQRALAAGINLRQLDDDKICLSFDERKTRDDITKLLDVLLGDSHGLNIEDLDASCLESTVIPENYQRNTDYLTHPVFNSHHSETEMLRYLKRLENKDFSLTHGM